MSWEFRAHRYKDELSTITPSFTPAESKHPLIPPTAEELKKQKQTKQAEFDPLSGSYDPLTYGMNAKGEFENDEDEPITFFTQSHLAAYSEQDMPANRFILRLEKLNNTDSREPEEVHELSFQGVIELADQRKSELVEAWKNDERVKSLKIVIQLCKFLTDVTYPYLYPRLFSIVCQALDMFGERVYERLCVMAFKTPQPGSFSPQEVDAKTKETAQNWLYKISSIRELIPRIFVEAALLRTFSFLLKDPYTDTLARLLQQTNGIGHPLVCAYARSYIVKKGLETDRAFKEIPAEDPMTALVFRGDTRGQQSGSIPINQGRGRTLQEKEKEKVIFRNNFDDFLFQLQNAKSDKRKEEMKKLGIDFSKYLRVYSPCMQMLITSLIRSNKADDICATLLQIHERQCADSLLLYHLIELSPANRVVAHIQTILEHIRKDPAVIQFLENARKKPGQPEAEPLPTAYNLPRLLSELGRRLCESEPPEDQKIPLLNTIWKMATRIQNIQEYLLVARNWIPYPILYCTDRETNILFTDIQRHVMAADAFKQKDDEDEETKPHVAAEEPEAEEKEGKKKKSLLAQAERVNTSLSVLPPPQSLLSDLLCQAASAHKSIGSLVGMSIFQQLSNLLADDDGRRLGAVIIKSFSRPNSPLVTDSVTAYYLFEMAKKAFLWVDSFTSAEETLRMDRALCQFAAKIDLGRDVDQQLVFYVDLRRVFPKFEQLKMKLILFVNALAMKACRFVNYHHNKRSLNFVKGCVAFSHVTCPSVLDLSDRIRLLLDSAYVALSSNLIGQAEVLLKMMVSDIKNLSENRNPNDTTDSEPELIERLSEFASLLLVMPGHPTYGPTALVRILLKTLQEYPWRKDSPTRGIIQVQVLALLGALSQRFLPYHVMGVDSNDALYAQSPEYNEDVLGLYRETAANVFEELQRLSGMTSPEARRSTVQLGLQFAEVLTSTAEITQAVRTITEKTMEMVADILCPSTGSAPSSLSTEIAHLKNFTRHLRIIADKKDASQTMKHLWSYIYSLQSKGKAAPTKTSSKPSSKTSSKPSTKSSSKTSSSSSSTTKSTKTTKTKKPTST